MKANNYNGVFKVGFSRADITPTKLPIQATESSSPVFKVVKDPLYATCIAVYDGEKTALIITLDLKGTYDYILTNMNDRIMKATGLPQENIMISAIHNHSAPASSDDGNKPKFPWDETIYNWLDEVFDKMGPHSKEGHRRHGICPPLCPCGRWIQLHTESCRRSKYGRENRP